MLVMIFTVVAAEERRRKERRREECGNFVQLSLSLWVEAVDCD